MQDVHDDLGLRVEAAVGKDEEPHAGRSLPEVVAGILPRGIHMINYFFLPNQYWYFRFMKSNAASLLMNFILFH